MAHKTNSEPAVINSAGLTTSTPSFPPFLHPNRSHHFHKLSPALPTITSTCNHTPHSTSEQLSLSPQSSSIFPSSTNTSSSCGSPQHSPPHRESVSTMTECKAAGSHVMLHDDHLTSHVGHMTLRRRDAQCVNMLPPTACPSLNLSQESNRFTRPKIKQQQVGTNGEYSPPASTPGGRKFPQLPPGSDTSPPGSGPARNLRYRPYPLGKT